MNPEPDEAGDASEVWDEDEFTRPETDSTSSPVSTEVPAARFRPIDPSTRRMYAAVVEQGATIASGLANARLDPEGDSFIMRPDEAQGVADPASRLLARHVPLSAAVAGQATDLSDIVELVTAVIGYAMAAFARRAGGRIDSTGMPDGTEGDVSDLGRATPDDYVPPAPMPAWPVPNMAPQIAAGA